MKSILQNKKECYACRIQYGTENTNNLHDHHIFFGNANRKLSEQDGLKVWLCWEHHEGTNGVHGKNGDNLNRMLKAFAGLTWCAKYDKEEEDFIKRYGKSYM